jgi:uncharacterized protein YbjT (DUF2867 family)
MIAVIGATGFTGRRLVAHLRRLYPDQELVAIVRPAGGREIGTNVALRTADLSDMEALRDAFRGAMQVVSVVSLGTGYAANLVSAIQAAAPDHAIFFSTTSIFTKVAPRSRNVFVEAERLIVSSDIPATIFRPTMIYGRPGDRNIERLLRFIGRSPLMPIVGSGAALQQPVHVDDLVTAVGSALGKATTIGWSYNLPGPRPMRFMELVSEAAQALGRKPIFVHLPLRLTAMVLRAWTTTGLAPRIRPEQFLRLAENKQVDGGRAVQHFGYAPREFGLGVREEAHLLGLADSDGVDGKSESRRQSQASGLTGRNP